MGLYDRDWVREAYKEKEQKYKRSQTKHKKALPLSFLDKLGHAYSSVEICPHCGAETNIRVDASPLNLLTVFFEFRCSNCTRIVRKITPYGILYIIAFSVFVIFGALHLLGFI